MKRFTYKYLSLAIILFALLHTLEAVEEKYYLVDWLIPSPFVILLYGENLVDPLYPEKWLSIEDTSVVHLPSIALYLCTEAD